MILRKEVQLHCPRYKSAPWVVRCCWEKGLGIHDFPVQTILVVVCSIGKELTTLSTLGSMDSGYMLKPYGPPHTRIQDSDGHGRSTSRTSGHGRSTSRTSGHGRSVSRTSGHGRSTSQTSGHGRSASQTSGHFSIGPTSIPTDLDTDNGHTALIASDASRTKPSRSSFLRWWFLEIVASIISVASLLSTVIVLRHYDGLNVNDLNLPSSITLNGIIAVIATLNRVALMVPVGSAMSQEAWLWFSSVAHKDTCRSRFLDLDLSDAASRGAWGSLVFLFVARRRFVPTSP